NHPEGGLMAKLSIGSEAPAFELQGTGSKTYKLSDYTGTGVILAFYPGDFTPVCTKQFCSYRDDGDRLQAPGVPVPPLSPHPRDTTTPRGPHAPSAHKHGLNVPLLSDPGKSVSRAYGVAGPGALLRRPVFLNDGE